MKINLQQNKQAEAVFSTFLNLGDTINTGDTLFRDTGFAKKLKASFLSFCDCISKHGRPQDFLQGGSVMTSRVKI